MNQRTLVPLALLLTVGCATPPPPAPPPPAIPEGVAITVHHFAGSPVSGPLREPAPPAKPEEALAIEVAFLALDRLPGEILEPLAAKARLIAPSRGGTPILATNLLTLGARAGAVGGADEFFALAAREAQVRPVTRLRGALAPGVTAVFTAADLSGPEALEGRAAEKRPGRIEVQVYREAAERRSGEAKPEEAPGPIDVALVVEGLVPADEDAAPGPGPASPIAETTPAGAPAPPAAPEAPTPPSGAAGEKTHREPIFQRETVLLDRVPAAGVLSYAIASPSPFTGGTARAIAALIVVRPAPSSGDAESKEHAEAAARASLDVERHAAIARERAAPPPKERPIWSGIENAMKGLLFPRTRRPALLYLADASGASVAEDIAFSAPEDVAAKFADLVIARCSAGGGPLAAEAARWALERSAFEVLAEAAESEAAPPEIEGILSRHAGEAGRGDVLAEIAGAAKDAADLEKRIIAENLIYLEDPSPAARMRAFDWLQARDLAPAGYDPLAPPRERRAALAAHAEAAAAEAAARETTSS